MVAPVIQAMFRIVFDVCIVTCLIKETLTSTHTPVLELFYTKDSGLFR